MTDYYEDNGSDQADDSLDLRIAAPDREPEEQTRSAAMSPERLSPHSVYSEEAVLGSILIYPDALLEIAAFLRTDDFFILKHGMVWDAMLIIQERGEAIDDLTLIEELRARNQLEGIGGEAFITHLLNSTPTHVHAETYGHMVERASIRRRLLGAASTIAQIAQDENADINEVIDRAESTLFGVTERNLRRELTPMRIAISDYYRRIEQQYEHRGEPVGIPTGFDDLDKLLGGLQRSDLIVVAARPGVGKTSLLLSMALNAARRGNSARVAIFSLEMSGEQLVQRFVSAETGINSQKLRTGELDDREWNLFTQAVGNLGNLRIYLDDTPSITPLQMRAKCRRLYREHGLDLIILDYLQLMSSGQAHNDNRVQEISYISRSLKELAREMNVPLVAAAQLSRQVEQRADKRPQLSDLRESGCLAGDTLIYLPESGRYVPIRDLAGKSDFRVSSLDTESWKLESAMVSNAFCTGTKPVFRLTTQLNRSIHATANHKFLTFTGWKRLDELTIGEHVAVPRKLNNSSVQTMSDAELGLLGHLIGDGCTLPNHSIQYTTREYDLAELVSSLSTQFFGARVVPNIKRERDWYQVYITSAQHLTHGVKTPVREWLDELEVFGLRSHEKHVPCKVFEQPQEAVALFLRHLWATDGCIRIAKSGYPAIYYASSSKRLATDVQSLLLRLGISAPIQQVPQKDKGRDQYHVYVRGNLAMMHFAKTIGAVGDYKQQSIQSVIAYVETHVANTNTDVIPRLVWRSLAVPSMQKHKITGRQMQAELGNAYCGTGLYKQNISRERALRFASVVRSPEIARLAESDIYWDTVASIEPDGESDVYDLTVPALSNFVANDIIVHNSIEQDADIVILIYRDELYNENSERPNQADLLISKHRSGSTGVVTLHFNKSITQFGNLQKVNVNVAGY